MFETVVGIAAIAGALAAVAMLFRRTRADRSQQINQKAAIKGSHNNITQSSTNESEDK